MTASWLEGVYKSQKLALYLLFHRTQSTCCGSSLWLFRIKWRRKPKKENTNKLPEANLIITHCIGIQHCDLSGCTCVEMNPPPDNKCASSPWHPCVFLWNRRSSFVHLLLFVFVSLVLFCLNVSALRWKWQHGRPVASRGETGHVSCPVLMENFILSILFHHP